MTDASSDEPATTVTFELPTLFLRPAHIDSLGVNAMLGIELHDGRPLLQSITFTEAVHPDLLADVDWPAHVNQAVAFEAFYSVTGGTFGEFFNPESMARVRDAAGRHKVVDQTLTRAVEAYRRGGNTPIKRVASELHVSERTASRYIARARKENLL